jgi:hypothetical protein
VLAQDEIAGLMQGPVAVDMELETIEEEMVGLAEQALDDLPSGIGAKFSWN